MNQREIEEWSKTRDFGLSYFTVADYIEEEIGRELKLHEAKACLDRLVGVLQDTYADEIEDIIASLKK